MRSNHYTMVARRLIRDSLQAAQIPEDAPIGVAVSGGADSSALLLALSTIYRGSRASLVHVLTVDHQLQAETAEVSRTVADFGERLGFQAHIAPVEVAASGDGSEADARRARYEVLYSLAGTHKLRTVLLGHTKSDQAEQVLLGLLRGSGTRSLSGIPQQRDIFLRPFLFGLSREQTELVCRENEYSYWNDPHNELTKYRRVALRKLISSVERETGQSIVEPLVRTAQISREDADALDIFAEIAGQKVRAASWSVDVLLEQPAAIRKRIYRTELLNLGAPSDSVGFQRLERIEDLILNWHGQGAVHMGASIEVSRLKDRLSFDTDKQ